MALTLFPERRATQGVCGMNEFEQLALGWWCRVGGCGTLGGRAWLGEVGFWVQLEAYNSR